MHFLENQVINSLDIRERDRECLNKCCEARQKYQNLTHKKNYSVMLEEIELFVTIDELYYFSVCKTSKTALT